MTEALVQALDLLVRSSLIAAAALGVAAVQRRGPAIAQVRVLRAGACLLAALPLLMWVMPAMPLTLLPTSTASLSEAPAAIWSGDIGPVAGVAVEAAVLRPSPAILLGWVWAAGVLIVLGRFALGVWTLRRWTRSAAEVTAPAWTGALRRLGGSRPPRLLLSREVAAPLSWGMPPGVVLIDAGSQARPETATAVLAHELAHLRHRDWVFLALSRLALALFWFNPLVWRLHVELIARTEEAADAAALAEVDPASYARTLVSLAADGPSPAALAMAGPAHTLRRRIACIMKTRTAAPSRPLLASLTIAGLVAVATPIAAVELAPRAPAPPQAPAAPPAPPVATAIAPMAPPAPPTPISAFAPEAPVPPSAPPSPPAPPLPPQVGPAEARAAAEQARAQAAEARAHSDAARGAALSHAAEARAHAQAAVAAGERARAAAEVHAAEAHRAAARAMAQARVQMALGAGQMMEGARSMRAEGERLRDPAYRAEQIERARRRGDRVPTDAELLDLSRRLPQQAADLEEQARRLREQAEDAG